MQTLCDQFSGYGALRCNYHDTGCKGAVADDCYPYHIWSGTQGSGSSYVSPYLGSGTINTANCTGGACSSTYAFTVRCVLDLESIQTTSGCPGAYNNKCYPYEMWSGSSNGSEYFRYNLANGSFVQVSVVSTYANSVRCVLDLKPADYCYPNEVWSSTGSGSSYHRGYLVNGSFSISSIAGTYAYGVRCVLDLEFTPA